ncbi:hypothetical protein [Pisciglobus halotolerans]|uniref:Uncharacterized protein n=1 Tax=Pisciglobus halotolerans TaxID=745365 RepID=A0A1I3C3G7_9LACT|nr:hypothetical protein [Pisciglobus halotolerans]SFH68876.1 hypothetical protein SAMN04489868_11261 [Pisciglobus halotolerans]
MESWVKDTKGYEYFVSNKDTFDRGWETMVFMSENQEVTDWGEVYQALYDNVDQAVAGHDHAVRLFREIEQEETE